jgi:hypothetical protein
MQLTPGVFSMPSENFPLAIAAISGRAFNAGMPVFWYQPLAAKIAKFPPCNLCPFI